MHNEEENYRRLKENIRMMKSDAENDELNGKECKRIENNKKILQKTIKMHKDFPNIYKNGFHYQRNI